MNKSFNENDGEEEHENDNVLRHRNKLIKFAETTFEDVSESLKKSIASAEHFFASKRLWLKTLSESNCDVVITFPSNTDDQFLSWLLTKLHHCTGLNLTAHYHASTQNRAFYVTAPIPILLKAAEKYQLPKVLKQTNGGGLKNFILQNFQQYEGADDQNNFFTSNEKQWLILKLLENVKAQHGDCLEKKTLLEGQYILSKCIRMNLISQIFPIHQPVALEYLQQMWVKTIFVKQPLDKITEYFGIKIGMYFAWLGHYTTALNIPAIVGLLFWLISSGKNQAVQDICYVAFSIFNVIWVTTYLQAWKRYSAELSFRWGTSLEQQQQQQWRHQENNDNDLLRKNSKPLFWDKADEEAVKGNLKPFYPAWKRYLFRSFVSVPLMAAALFIVFFIMVLSLQIQDWWDSIVERGGLPRCLEYLPKIMLAIIISLMDQAYFKIALWLNDKENYHLDTVYESHLIGKVALFQFVNSFLSLFYIAFYLQDQARLKEQLAVLLISRQVISNLKESILPYLLEQLKIAKVNCNLLSSLNINPKSTKSFSEDDAEHNRILKESEPHESTDLRKTINQAELESSLYKYNGTFADYLEMTMQLGYVILFSSAFPLAAFCALLNNLIQIRSDAFKLTYVCQRPFGQRISNIGTWQNCMEYMSIVAILVNCALIGLSGQVHRMFPNMTATQTVLLIVALEHIVLVIRFIITCVIPDIPDWLVIELARMEWMQKNADNSISVTPIQSQLPTPTEPEVEPKTIGRFSVSPIHQIGTKSSSISTHKSEEPIINRRTKPTTLESVSTGKLLSNRSSPTLSPSTPSSLISHPRNALTPAPLTAATASNGNQHKMVPLGITPDSIQQIPPFRPRKSKEWAPMEMEASSSSSHHLTIGPSGGVEWTKKMKEENDIHRSSDCISSSKDHSTSDNELHTASPMWPPRPRSSMLNDNLTTVGMAGTAVTSKISIKSQIAPFDPSLSDSAKSISSQEADESAKEELAAKKNRVKQSLMKRARSVAIFSLKLKERRAREAHEKASVKTAITPSTPLPPPHCGGGELSCIPIEKLIQLDDVRRNVEAAKPASNNQQFGGTL